jgi:hypothetical protein
MTKRIDPDHLQRRCPMLGGPVTLAYCEQCGQRQKTCHKIFDCWWEMFDVAGYLQGKLSTDEYQELTLYRPTNKISSLLDCIEKARTRH